MTASDFLIQNGGRLDAAWFEPHNLDTLLTAWLNAATGSDQAVEAVVRPRSETLVNMVMTRPARVSADDVSEAYSDAQLAHWQRQANSWRGKPTPSPAPPAQSSRVEGAPTWRN